MTAEGEREVDRSAGSIDSAATFVVPVGIVLPFLFLLSMEILLFLVTIAFTLALGVKTAN